MKASSQSLMLSIMPAPRSPGVTFYTVKIDGNPRGSSCNVSAAETAMQCTLEGLAPNIEYKSLSAACLKVADSPVCSEAVSLIARTNNSGK